jgi:galactose mutarotase-like enzyme
MKSERRSYGEVNAVLDRLDVLHTHIQYIWDELAERTELRDQFAMAALIGGLAGRVPGDRTEWAKAAYQTADAMMEARKKDD